MNDCQRKPYFVDISKSHAFTIDIERSKLDISIKQILSFEYEDFERTENPLPMNVDARVVIAELRNSRRKWLFFNFN